MSRTLITIFMAFAAVNLIHADPTPTTPAQPAAVPDIFVRQQDDNLCAHMTFSGVLAQLFAPSIGLLQESCRVACESSRQRCDNYITRSSCVWQNAKSITIQNFYITNQRRCEERCTQASVWSGDCNCALSALRVQTVRDGDILEQCDGLEILDPTFPDGTGWSNRIASEGPSFPCESNVPP